MTRNRYGLPSQYGVWIWFYGDSAQDIVFRRMGHKIFIRTGYTPADADSLCHYLNTR